MMARLSDEKLPVFVGESGMRSVRRLRTACALSAVDGTERRLGLYQLGVEFVSHLLSPRLRQCLILASKGHTAVEIGFILGLSYRTVNQYLSDAYKRLGARNRMQAVAIAIQRGEIPPLEAETPPPSPGPAASPPGQDPPPPCP